MYTGAEGMTIGLSTVFAGVVCTLGQCVYLGSMYPKEVYILGQCVN